MILSDLLNRLKGSVCVLGFLLMLPLSIDAQLFDNFSDGDFTNNPIWTGTTENFIVNAQQRLQLTDTDPVIAQSYLTTPNAMSSLNNKEWRILVNQTFAGSDANNSRIYLTASGNTFSFTGNNTAGVQGYYLKLGEAGSSDVIKFYRDNGTATTLIASCTTLIASSFTVRIKIVRDDAGNWTISTDHTGGENFTTEASFSEGTFNNAAHFGIVCSYTASNASNFYFDDIYAGDIIVDTTAPQVLSATATSANTIDVLFNENVELASSQTLSYYSVNSGIGTPLVAQRDASNLALVHLSYTNALTPNQSYILTAQNVQDEYDNAMPAQQIPFTYYEFGEAAHRDIVFNEILADPSPVVGLPEAEFVELYNAHPTSTFNLNGWEFVNTNTIKILPAFDLAPNSYVILCDVNNVAQFEPYGDVIGIPSFTALANSADSLTLKKPSGEIIDMVYYRDSWFATTAKRDGGWTLELVNPYFPCQSSANWRESEQAEGGTPGAVNSVYDDTPDNIAPTVINVSVASNQSIIVTFSEAVDTTGYSIPDWSIIPFNSVAGAVWNSTLSAVTLQTQQVLSAPNTYQITVSGMSDCSGNEMTPQTFDFTLGFIPQPGDVAINEIMADPDPVVLMPAAEYVELRNNTSTLLDISSLRLNNGVFIGQVLLYPDSFIVVAHINNATSFFNIPNVAFMNSFPGLTNSGMLLELKTADGTIHDSVNYSDSWYKDDAKKDGGWSLELINPSAPCSGGYNWRASTSTLGGTAGYQNAVFSDAPDETMPAYQYFVLAGEQGLLFYFDKPLGAEFLDNIIFTVNGTAQTALDIQLGGPENNAVLIGYTNIQAGQLYHFALEGVTDCWGNTAGIVHGSFGLPEEPAAGDIIINEVLHNPFDGGSDFIEIYNRSPKVISLNGWKIADATSGNMNSPKNIALTDYLLMPSQYLVLTRRPSAQSQFYAGTVANRLWTVVDLPDYSSSDEVYLLFGIGNVVSDHLIYDSDMHYPLLNSTKGISLERISFSRPTSDETNWHSASSSAGFATPGYRNSQSQEGMSAGTDLTVSPEIFSPDNDGYNDVVTFSYKLDKEGYTGNIKIFDSEGRHVRHLMKSELLGIEGSISWDGFSDERQKATVGIYMVFFEAFTPDGSIVKNKKSCVLAHQLN